MPKLVEMVCVHCGIKKMIPYSNVRIQKYCSISCSRKIRKGMAIGNKRVSWNGYIEIYNPAHHRARANGYVFEHIVVVEEKLGRKLLRNEQVHHVDRNKKNNNPLNLVVMDIVEHSRETGRLRRERNMHACQFCGQVVYRKPSQIKKNKRVFCSQTCLGKAGHTSKEKKGRFNYEY